MFFENSEVNTSSTLNIEVKIFQSIDSRQSETLKYLPKYSIWTLVFSALAAIIAYVLKLRADNFEFQSLGTIGGIISFVITFLVYLINAYFAVWALTFVGFITYRSYRSANTYKLPIRTKPFKWLQLFASSVFSLAIFAICWANFAKKDAKFSIELSGEELLYVGLFGIAIWGILWAITNYLPMKFVLIHLTIFSTLLYSSIFLAYGLGLGTASFAALIGILFYLSFSSNKVTEIWRRICIYDLDTELGDKLADVANQESEIKVKEIKVNIDRQDLQLKNRVENLKSEEKVSEQLTEIQKEKLDFNSRVNETVLKTYQQKIKFLNKMYDILAKEQDSKLNEQLPKIMQELEQNAKNYSPKELNERMIKVIEEMNQGLDSIPQSLNALKEQLVEATKQLQVHTKQLTEGNENKNEE